MPKLSTKPHTVTLDGPNGWHLVRTTKNEREARTLVAYCSADNCGHTRAVSNGHANAVVIGQPYTLERYTFLLEPTVTP